MIPLETRLFSWTDIEDFLLTLQRQGKWPVGLKTAQAYWDRLTLTVEPKAKDDAEKWLAEIFEPRYQDGSILLESRADFPRKLPVYITDAEESEETTVVFRPTLQLPAVLRTLPPKATPENFPADAPKIIAFHSFKGGVGRTLHALATALAISGEQQKILLIDGDMEAPGITWMLADRMPAPAISFADFLTLLHGDSDPCGANALDLIADRIQTSRLEQIFLLPAFRSKEQFSRLQVKPENLTQWADNPFIITDSLSRLGKMIDAAAVIVDLRAGLSEFSAGLLLDPRVHRMLVTTLSSQSLEGTAYLLNLLDEMSAPGKDYPLPKVMISQIPDIYMQQKEILIEPAIRKIEDAAKNFWNIQEPLGLKQPHILLTIHEQNLMVVPRAWDEVMEKMNRSELLKDVREKMEHWGFIASESIFTIPSSGLPAYRKKLAEYIENRMDTESGTITSLLPIAPLRHLANDFRKILPIAVVSGDEGTGKTFAFLHIIRCGDWKHFVSLSGITSDDTVNALCCPVVCPEYLRDDAKKMIHTADERIKSELGLFETVSYEEIKDYLLNCLEPNHEPENWRDFWLDLMAWRMGFKMRESGAGQRLAQLLQEKKKKIIAVLDGLEDLLPEIRIKDREDIENKRIKNPIRTESFFKAVNALLMDVPAWLDRQPERPLGILVFMRKSLIRNALSENSETLMARYAPYELKWNAADALRLSAWIFQNAMFPEKSHAAALFKCSPAQLSANLLPIWGEQTDTGNPMPELMLQALSDENENIRSIDIVRFIRMAVRETPDQQTDSLLISSSISKAGKEYFMQLTPKQEMKLRRLSDEQLYRDAVKFIEDHKTIKLSQMSGLESIAESADGFSKVVEFINHQAEKGQKDKEKRADADFFHSLRKYFEKLKTDVQSDRDFIPDALTKTQLKEYTEYFGLLFAREFIHHLAAENRYKSEE